MSPEVWNVASPHGWKVYSTAITELSFQTGCKIDDKAVAPSQNVLKIGRLWARKITLYFHTNSLFSDSLGLHRVENPSHTETAVSLHLYCPPYDKCSVFNQNTGQRSSSTVTFWSMYGQKRNRVMIHFISVKPLLLSQVDPRKGYFFIISLLSHCKFVKFTSSAKQF